MAPRVVRFLMRPLVIIATALSLIEALAYPRTFIGAFLVTWLVVYGVGSLARRAWWRFTYPAIPPWSKPSARRLGSRMLREDLNAHIFFDRKGFLFKKRYWFVGTGCLPTPIPSGSFQGLQEGQVSSPMQIAANGERTWWWFADRFYWENQGYSAKDVMALVRNRERRQERQLQRAHDMLTLDADPTPRRAPIPQEVRRAVYLRDGGRCVNCGSTFDLQYDHILPVALGGATTAENLQLLCSACNREKSDSL